MTHTLRTAAVMCGVAGMLAIGAPTPALAQVVVVDPPYYGYGYGRPRVYVSPYAYGAYAYAPGYGRYWGAPFQYDSAGVPYTTYDLGYQWGPPGGAPANPCWSSQRAQSRC
jgi:hypothetical protein